VLLLLRERRGCGRRGCGRRRAIEKEEMDEKHQRIWGTRSTRKGYRK